MAEELGYPALLEHRDGTLTRNTAAERVTPEPCADLRSALASLFAAGVDESLEAALEACRQGEHRSICVEGVKVVAAPTSAGVLVIVARDPDELASLARRATAGEMAAGVAHEVANALSSVIGWCSLARNDPASAPPELALDRAIQGAEIARDAAR
ncbi:MAG: hypothetical protein H5U40_05605, partial [Polyangiaceae bacterium]|nr:hypothetical protein [Polyangiaceae bacterium]